MIYENCIGCWGAPTIAGSNLPKFSNVPSPKPSKTVFLEVFCIKWTK